MFGRKKKKDPGPTSGPEMYGAGPGPEGGDVTFGASLPGLPGGPATLGAVETVALRNEELAVMDKMILSLLSALNNVGGWAVSSGALDALSVEQVVALNDILQTAMMDQNFARDEYRALLTAAYGQEYVDSVDAAIQGGTPDAG